MTYLLKFAKKDGNEFSDLEKHSRFVKIGATDKKDAVEKSKEEIYQGEILTKIYLELN